MFLLLVAVRVAIFAIPAIAGDECPPDPGDGYIIAPFLRNLI
jgi:hypothetical protein